MQGGKKYGTLAEEMHYNWSFKGITPWSENVVGDMLALTCKGKIVTGKSQRSIAHDAKINFNYDP
jgi:hypothetical protein